MRRTLGSRKGIGAGAMIALCLSAASAVAQDRPVTTRQDRADTVKINVSGRVEMDYVVREAALMTLNGMGTFAGSDNSVNTIEGEVAVRLDAELSEKVSVVVEIGRLRVSEDLGALGLGVESGVVPFFGIGGNALDQIALREAHLKVADFLAQGLTAHMGISNWSFGSRPGRGSLAFDPHYAQSITRNMTDGQDAAGAMAARYGIASAQELEAMGIQLSYTSGQITLDFVALPMVIEGGEVPSDEALYAVDLWYNLDQMGKGSRIGAIVAFHNIGALNPVAGDNETRMITFGAAANLVFGQLEIFAEGYVQTGEVGSNAAGDGVDAAGHALQIGGRYNAGGDSNAWIELSFTLISGDDDTDDEVGNFIGYESVNDFLIIEDMYFGLDIDANLTAIKVMGGASFGVAGGKNNLDLQAGLGFFTTTEKVVAGTDEDDALGTELNVKARYHLNKQAALVLNFGMLFGSDLLEEMGGGAASDVADDSTWLASLGFDVRY